MLRPGPFVCAGERKVVIAVFCPRRSTASVPWGSGRCGAAEFRVLDVAVDAMAVERAEHERVQVQVQVRARMPLLPRCCGVCRAPSPRRLVVASVDGSDAYRAEAEPLTAKRSGTG